MLSLTYHTTKRLPDAVLEIVQRHTTLERILVWTSNIADMVQMDEFSSDIVIAVGDLWLDYDVT
jgi:hypothetical protein